MKYSLFSYHTLMYNFHCSHQVNNSSYQIAAGMKRGDKAVERIEMVRCEAYSTTQGNN